MAEDSLMDLYRKAANPLRTNRDKIRLNDTPFVRDDVRSRESSRRSEDDEVESRNSRQSSRRSRQSSRRSRQSSRRSQQSSRRSQQSSRARSRAVPKSPPAFFASQKRSRLTENQLERLRVEKEREKQVLLHELSRMQMGGSQVCRNMSMNNNLADIEYELNRTKAKDDCVSTVAFMKDAIKFGVTGIEMLNSKFKVLKLQGWGNEATRDMNRYDRSLTKLYTRYMRKGSVSPILELGFLLFGSMLITHMKNSFLGGLGGPAAAAPAAAAPPPPSRNVPFQRPPAPASRPPDRQQQPPVSRPTMRQPVMRQPPAAPPVVQQMRPTMRRPNVSSTGPLPGVHVPPAVMSTAPTMVVAPPTRMTVMMMTSANPVREDTASETSSEPSIEEVDLEAKKEKEVIDEIDARSEASGDTVLDDESMRF